MAGGNDPRVPGLVPGGTSCRDRELRAFVRGVAARGAGCRPCATGSFARVGRGGRCPLAFVRTDDREASWSR